LALGHALLRTSISILTERHPINPLNEGQIGPYRVGHALCFKACKTYRSILHLTEIGASHDVTQLGRTLFETVLANQFVLVPRVAFGIKGFSDSDLTSELRACIYVDFQVISKYRDLVRHMGDPRFSTVLANIDIERERKRAAQAEQEIGQFWTNRIESHPRTYSGFSVRELADKLDPDLSKWYAGLYGEQSKSIHATDGISHIRFDNAEQRFLPKWHSSIWDVQSALLAASSFMWRCIADLHNRFHFGKSPHEDIDTKTELDLAIAMLNRIEEKMQAPVKWDN
jgi:hypothetical protein